MKIKTVLFIIGVSGLASSLYGHAVMPLSTAIIDIQYEEPTQNMDGSPLTNLDHITIYYKFIGTEDEHVIKTIPASSINGGGIIKTSIDIPITSENKSKVCFWITAMDKTGEQVAKSPEMAVIELDFLPPNKPE